VFPVGKGATEMIYLWVFLGSALGGVMRHWVTSAAARGTGETFPWGTIIVNISGSFLIALFSTLTIPQGNFPASLSLRTFVMVGFFGGYTTVSSFALQTLNLARYRGWRWAAANILTSIVLCLAGAWLGFVVGVATNHAGSG
jgi:CrcB protein